MLFKAHQKIEDQGQYDVIIIGGGLAGLTAANTLAKNQKKVLLLESHNKLGGFATWFNRRGGHIFDVSLHGFPSGMIKTCRKYWTKEIAEMIIQLHDIRFINPQFQIQTTFTKEDFSDKLVHHFHIDEEMVKKFFNDVFSMNFYDDQKLTTKELFNRYFPDRNDVHRFLMEPITYANGSTLLDPAISYGIVFSNFMNKGVFTFQGGTDQLITKMKEELLKNGVDIKLQAKVDRIVVEKMSPSRVQGVMIKNDFISAKVILSNAHLLSTITDLVGEEFFSDSFISEVKKVKINSSSCQIYMGIKKGETIPRIGDLIFTSTAPIFDTDLVLAKKITSRTFSLYYPEARPGSERSTIVCSTNANYSDWENLSEEEYQKEKEEMIEETLHELEKLIPDVRSKIDFLQAATPRTIKRFTLHPQGTSFGTKFEGLKISQDLPKEIQGLFHAGSVGIIMSGWLGAANYGVIVSNEIESYFYNQQNQNKDY